MRFRGLSVLFFTVLSAGIWGFPVFQAGAGQRYQIDRENSSILVFTDSAGVFKTFGEKLVIEVREFSGTLELNRAALTSSSLRMKMATHSLALKTQVSALDRENIEIRMHEKVLQTLRFPEIEFVSDTIEVNPLPSARWEVTLYGRLSLHGVTRRFPVQALVTLKKDEVEAIGEISLKQSDFKIKPYAYTGGALRVADVVKISFNIKARRQDHTRVRAAVD